MVSFQSPSSLTQRETTSIDDHELMINLTKKRKREEPPVNGIFGTSMFNKEIHPETPLPLEWLRCLNIESGDIHYFNTKTQRRTTRDRTSHEPSTYNQMSLDLEVNLPCGSLAKKISKSKNILPSSSSYHFPKNIPLSSNRFESKNTSPLELTLFPSRSELYKDDEDVEDEKEMITSVCKKCHMLVMMYKSSPSCPNCKFMPPIDRKAPYYLLNQSLSLFS